MSSLVLVCVGGAVGSGLRYLTGMLAVHWLGAGFPYGTLAVNLVGAFLIGLVQQAAATELLSQDSRLMLSTGVMGGLTTYSAFSYETVRLFETGAAWQGWLYVVVTTAACVGLCFLGLTTGRVLLAPR